MLSIKEIEENYVLDEYIRDMEKRVYRHKEIRSKINPNWERARVRSQKEIEDESQVLAWLSELNSVKKKREKCDRLKDKVASFFKLGLPFLFALASFIGIMALYQFTNTVSIHDERSALISAPYAPVELTIGETMSGTQVINMINNLSEHESDRENYVVVNNGKTMVTYTGIHELAPVIADRKHKSYIERDSVYEVMDYIETDNGKLIAVKITATES